MINEILKQCGVEEEKANEIVKAMSEAKIYTTNLENADVRYNKLQEQKKQYEESAKELEKQLKNVQKNNGDVEALNKTIEQLQLSNKELEASHKSEMEKLQFEFALENALTGAKSKNNKAVKALLDLSNINYQEGNLNGLEEQLNALKQDCGYLFDVENVNQGGFNPNSSEKTQGITKENFKSMNMAQRIKLRNDNPSLYEELSQ